MEIYKRGEKNKQNHIHTRTLYTKKNKKAYTIIISKYLYNVHKYQHTPCINTHNCRKPVDHQ